MAMLTINGEQKSFEAPSDMPLLWVLRDVLGLTGTKFGCGIAQCGACTVHVDGQPLRSCMLAVGAIGNRKITTIEALGETPAGAILMCPPAPQKKNPPGGREEGHHVVHRRTPRSFPPCPAQERRGRLAA